VLLDDLLRPDEASRQSGTRREVSLGDLQPMGNGSQSLTQVVPREQAVSVINQSEGAELCGEGLRVLAANALQGLPGVRQDLA